MYKAPPSSDILQGDVISNFSYPVFTDVALSHSRSSGKHEFTGRVTIKAGHIAMVSHSCDLVIHEKGPKRPALLFCPLIRVPQHIRSNPQRYEILRRNKIDPAKPSFVSLFWFMARTPLEEDMVIDFSTMQALPITILGSLVEKKILELDDQCRGLLQEKLMHHFGRTEQET
jgi:hypothetical protein